MLPILPHTQAPWGRNKEQGLSPSENLPEQGLKYFAVAFYTLPDCLQKVCTKFTPLLAVLFEKNHFHTNLQFFPWIWNTLPGRFSEEAHEEMAERQLSEQGVSGWQPPCAQAKHVCHPSWVGLAKGTGSGSPPQPALQSLTPSQVVM